MLKTLEESPESWAYAKLKEMTARDADWNSMKSSPPNQSAERLALRVLRLAHSLRPLEPYVTASADGGVGVVYKTSRAYAAVECLNTGRLWFLWFDAKGEPQSRKVRRTTPDIKSALDQITTLLANA